MRAGPQLGLGILLVAWSTGCSAPSRVPPVPSATQIAAERRILAAAAEEGLRPSDYLGEGPEGFAAYVRDRRWGRFNPGTYGTRPGDPAPLVAAVLSDPAGIEAALAKLDPPFPEFAHLRAVLARDRDSAPPERIAQIERTLERWRWLPREFPNGVILVNIPERYVRVFDAGLREVLSMRAIVGAPRTPTPQFAASIEYIEFGPYWNVPRSILRNEMLPQIRKDRMYLAKGGYEVLDATRRVVSAGEVTDPILAGLESGTLHVRQRPGPNNAMGRVKFMFPNQDNVYLHDTNNRTLFARDKRDLSHGCVRIEKPRELAEWLLRDYPGWSPERVAQEMQRLTPLRVDLRPQVPVLLVYHTVTVAGDGQLRFHPDLYQQDAALAKRMGR